MQCWFPSEKYPHVGLSLEVLRDNLSSGVTPSSVTRARDEFLAKGKTKTIQKMPNQRLGKSQREGQDQESTFY